MEAKATDRAARVVQIALALNVLVAVLKIGYGRWAEMLSIEADGYHSLTDGFASLVALAGLAIARRPPSAKYPYGHRKYEVIAGIVIGASLLLMAAEVVSEVVLRLDAGRAALPNVSAGAFVVLAFTLAVNLGVSSFQLREGRRLSSALLLSDAKHTRADCYITLGVLAAAVLTWLGQPGLDVAAAAVIAVLVGKAGVDVIRENTAYLTDAALVEPDAVARVVEGIPPVARVHSVRTRGVPNAVFMDLRISLPDQMSIATAGDVVTLASEAIRDEFPEVVDVVIHAEPVTLAA
ncbi:MAG: cation diffusion facilitator family transporter [Myxococcota bacterium]